VTADGRSLDLGAGESITAEGRGATFEAAVGHLYPALVRRLVAVLGSEEDARDVAQEAYLRAFAAWDRFDGRDARAWLWTIALRLAFNERRRLRRRIAALGRLAAPTWADAGDPDLAAALSRLDPKSRAALVLTAVDGFTHDEAAAILGVPSGTVASRVSRARASLRGQLSSEDAVARGSAAAGADGVAGADADSRR
jgi:RNA polymerase sigma-70 factor (ECF subfamily)